ncbi:unnamed protein product, partial [Prorocentrum cordatum]
SDRRARCGSSVLRPSDWAPSRRPEGRGTKCHSCPGSHSLRVAEGDVPRAQTSDDVQEDTPDPAPTRAQSTIASSTPRRRRSGDVGFVLCLRRLQREAAGALPAPAAAAGAGSSPRAGRAAVAATPVVSQPSAR